MGLIRASGSVSPLRGLCCGMAIALDEIALPFQGLTPLAINSRPSGAKRRKA